MEDDLKWLGVSGEDDQVSHTFVQGFCCLVSTLLQLYHLTERLATAFRSEKQNHIDINSIIRNRVLNIKRNSVEGNCREKITSTFRVSVVYRDTNVIPVCIGRRS